jgi:YggT family protein
MAFVINLINILVQLITILVIIKVVLSYFMSPYQPVRMFIDRLVDPMLWPIQRVIPSLGMLDFSPFILIILVQVLGRIIINILITYFG